MPSTNEKGQPASRPDPIITVHHDKNNRSAYSDYVQALAHSVFGHRYIVVHEPIGDRFRKRVQPRIRAWRGAP